MKYFQFLLLTIGLLTVPQCACDKKQAKLKKRGFKTTPEIIINNSINVRSTTDDFTVNVINTGNGLISNNIRQILFEKNNILLLADNGIIRIQKNTGRIVNFAFVDRDINFSKCLEIGNRIIITEKSGLYQFADNKLLLKAKVKNIIPKIFNMGNHIYFFTSDGKLYTQQVENTNITLIKNFTNHQFDYVLNHGKKIYLASKNKLFSLSLNELSLSNIIMLSNENINYILQEEDKLYFGRRSLYEFNIPDGIARKIINITNHQFITYIYKEKNRLYIGKNHGITLIRLIQETTHKGLMKSEEILDLFAVKNAYINYINKNENILWIGTKNNGVIKYIRKKRG